MAEFPAASKADVSVWTRVVDFVAGQHMDELIARATAAKGGSDNGMLSSEGAPPNGTATPSSPIRKLLKENVAASAFYKDAGLSPEDVIAHAKARGHDETEYAKMLTRKFGDSR